MSQIRKGLRWGVRRDTVAGDAHAVGGMPVTWRPVDLDPVALVMVGKPARGKTFTARRIARYTNWLGYRAKVFNVGRYRRQYLGPGQPASFFDVDNEQGMAARRRMAEAAVDDLVRWLDAGGEIGILDATNSSRARRAWIAQQCIQAGVSVMYVEVVCDDPDVILRNVAETKVTGPDYVGRAPDEASEDFFARIAQYEKVYESVGDDEGSYIRIIDLGRRIEAHKVHGFLPGRLVTFLMHLHDVSRPIYLTRHGESAYNVNDRIGGDAPLSPEGSSYAQALATFVDEHFGDDAPLRVWTSSLQRTVHTAMPMERPVRSWKLLDEIDAGVCDGMTYAEIADSMPDDYAARKADKFRYRYPQGESYQDVIARLDPVILELERAAQPVLVVGHQAVLRALLCYLTGSPPEKCPYLEVPLHTVIRITPGPYGSKEERFPLLPAPH